MRATVMLVQGSEIGKGNRCVLYVTCRNRPLMPHERCALECEEVLSVFGESGHELRARGYTELGERSVQVRAHRAMRQIKALPDLAIG